MALMALQVQMERRASELRWLAEQAEHSLGINYKAEV